MSETKLEKIPPPVADRVLFHEYELNEMNDLIDTYCLRNRFSREFALSRFSPEARKLLEANHRERNND